MSDRPVLLMTRPKAASERFLAELARDGVVDFDVVISPLFDIEPAKSLPDLTGIAALAFTSANAVACYVDLGGRLDIPCYTVGPATTEAAKSRGMAPIPSTGSAVDLQTLILRNPPDGLLFHLHGTHVTGNLARDLTDAGVPTHSAVIYDQAARSLNKMAFDALISRLPVVIPVFSPRSGQLLACTLAQGTSLLVAAMSSVVADTVQGERINRICIAQTPDSASMRLCVAQLMQEAHSLMAEWDV